MAIWYRPLAQFVTSRWGKVKPVRGPFFALLALGCLVVAVPVGLAIWWAMDWRYSGQLDKKDATIETLGTTIQSQREWLDEYRQKAAVTPEKASDEIEERQAKTTNLEDKFDPKFPMTTETFIPIEGGTYIYRRFGDVISKFTPNGLLIQVKADGIIKPGVRIKSISDPLPKIQPLTVKDGFYRVYVRQPHGRYEISVYLKSKTDVLLVAKYD